MAPFRTLVGLGLASTLMITAPVFASTPATSTNAAAKPVTHSVVKQTAATRVTTTAAPKRVSATRQNTHLVKTTLSNGKRVTYDCRLAGNKNKQACKG